MDEGDPAGNIQLVGSRPGRGYEHAADVHAEAGHAMITCPGAQHLSAFLLPGMPLDLRRHARED